jgi:hypothetical protein
LEIGGVTTQPGESKTIELQVGRLYDYTALTLPLHVIRGKEDGPTLFVSGAVHGDELVGVAIVKRIVQSKRLKKLRGTLIALPIVNVYGFNTLSRYLPDRRDLNRSFPGSKKGSLASRIAALFMNEIVKKSQYGIDFHSGALHRSNLPQIRTQLDDPKNKELAEAFGVPVILDSKLRDGSLREAAADLGVKMLLFEGGEALRLDDRMVRLGARGAMTVMEKIGMLPPMKRKETPPSYVARSSYWVRAPQAGMIRYEKGLGSKVKAGATLGTISDAFGENEGKVTAPVEGIIIGQLHLPLVNQGDALYHIATFEHPDIVRELAEDLSDYNDNIP